MFPSDIEKEDDLNTMLRKLSNMFFIHSVTLDFSITTNQWKLKVKVQPSQHVCNYIMAYYYSSSAIAVVKKAFEEVQKFSSMLTEICILENQRDALLEKINDRINLLGKLLTSDE